MKSSPTIIKTNPSSRVTWKIRNYVWHGVQANMAVLQAQEGRGALLSWLSTLPLLQALYPRRPRYTAAVYPVCEKSCVSTIPIRWLLFSG